MNFDNSYLKEYLIKKMLLQCFEKLSRSVIRICKKKMEFPFKKFKVTLF